jgi:hypothetical protein
MKTLGAVLVAVMILVGAATVHAAIVPQSACPTDARFIPDGNIPQRGGELWGECILPEVPAPAPVCATPPALTILGYSPDVIEARNHRDVDVQVHGRVTVPEGCAVTRAAYTLDDEYNELDGGGTLSVGSDGRFDVTVAVKASRRGNDRDGRTYTIALAAENEAGRAVGQALTITVSHDNR